MKREDEVGSIEEISKESYQNWLKAEKDVITSPKVAAVQQDPFVMREGTAGQVSTSVSASASGSTTPRTPAKERPVPTRVNSILSRLLKKS